MATYEQVMEALRQADAAGATEDARRLAALAISLRPDTAAPSSEGYMAEALRKGPASTAGTAAGLSGMVAEQLRRLRLPTAAAGMPGVPLSAVATMAGELGSRVVGAPVERPMTQAFTQAREPVYQGLMGALGSTGAEPQTMGEKIVAGGLQAATSPESYLFPPLAGVRRLGVLGQTVMRPAEQVAIGAGAEAGGLAGEAAAGTPGRIIGGVVGGAGAGFGMGSAMRTTALGGKALDLAKSQWDRVRGTVPEDELLKDVDNRISNVFIAAAAADPKFMDTLTKAAKAQEGVSLRAPGGASVQMPISALLADNPVINSFIQSLASRDEVFRAQYSEQFKQAKQALTANQIRLFGDPTKVQVNVVGPDLAKVQARRVRSIDEQIAEAYRDQSVDPTAFGQRVSSLLAKREDEARASTRPLYDEAFNIAKTKNIELPAASVDDIYNFVAGAQSSDVFKTFPSIYNRVRSRFRPETTEPSPILTAEGRPMAEGGQRFTAATVEDLDSLKREINKQLRRTTDPADIRLLSELKSRVAGHIDNLDPEFVTAYRNADNAYLQRVGLPFTAETLRSIDRKKFVEQIAPAIIGNRSNVDEFIRATGEDGVRVARDAFLDNFSRAALKNDVLDPKAAAKWIRANEGGMALIPGLRDELQAASTNVQNLIAQRNRLNADFQRVAGEQIVSQNGFKSPQELVARMYGDVKFTNKFMQQYGADKDSVNAARAFMLDDIVNSGDPVALLNDRTKAAVFNRVFGPTYAQKVADFAVVSERLGRDITQVPFRPETVPRTLIEQATGIPPEQIISRFYNPVSGPFYAMTSLFSKFWAKKASDATEERLKNLLLNPTDAAKVFQSVAPKAGAQFSAEKAQELVEIGRKYGINWVQDAVNDLTTGATRGAVQGTEE